MSDAPERIWASNYDGQDWQYADCTMTKHDEAHEYIRADHVDALIAAAYVSASQECLGLNADDVIDSIRALTPTDARAALDALLKAEREAGEREGREKALREALAACERALSDMQRDNPDRHDALPYIEDGCGACQDAILALTSRDKTDAPS